MSSWTGDLHTTSFLKKQRGVAGTISATLSHTVMSQFARICPEISDWYLDDALEIVSIHENADFLVS